MLFLLTVNWFYILVKNKLHKQQHKPTENIDECKVKTGFPVEDLIITALKIG